MKKFITKTIFISLPIILIGIFIELFISYYPNTFNTKASYLNSNLKNIEYLFLGSSHTQNSINPKFLDLTAANVAYGSQDYQLDSAIFFKYINRLNKIKTVFIEMDYHSLEKKNDADYFRLPWYYKYYDINLYNFKPNDKMSLFLSNPSFFRNYLIDKMNPFNKHLIINKFGFVENDSDIFEKLNFNATTIAQTSIARLKNRYTSESIANFEFNKIKILSIISYCDKNNIEVIVLKNPVYKTYRKNYIKDKEDRNRVFLDSLSLNRRIKLLDFEADSRFNIKDFKNDDHLNSKGAEKLSTFINDKLSEWK
jgi:hypothetical protein